MKKKTLQQIAEAMQSTGPDRYLVNALTGETLTLEGLKLAGGNPLQAAVILIRDDGWSLAVQLGMLIMAWRLFEERWIGIWLKGQDWPIAVGADQGRLLDQLQVDLQLLDERDRPNHIELRFDPTPPTMAPELSQGAERMWFASAHWGSGDDVRETCEHSLMSALSLLVQQLYVDAGLAQKAQQLLKDPN
jgi:hypothetical protein